MQATWALKNLKGLFWPGMSTEITDMIGNCSICLEYRNKQQKEHLIPHEIPDQPWIKLVLICLT